MIIKIIDIKTWCNAYLSPVAWTRIIIESMSNLNTIGYTLQELNNPSDDIFFDNEALQIVDQTCYSLYKRHIKFLDLIEV